MTIFTCHFTPPCEVSDGTMCVFATVILCLCQDLFCLSVSSLTFTEKSDCEKVNHVVSMISSATTFVKLWQRMY